MYITLHISVCENAIGNKNGHCLPITECKTFEKYTGRSLSRRENYLLSNHLCSVKNGVRIMCCETAEIKNNAVNRNDTLGSTVTEKSTNTGSRNDTLEPTDRRFIPSPVGIAGRTKGQSSSVSTSK